MYLATNTWTYVFSELRHPDFILALGTKHRFAALKEKPPLQKANKKGDTKPPSCI